MAHTVADVAGLPAEHGLLTKTCTMTSLQWRLAVVAELVLGAVLGSLFLGTHSLFLDESVSSTLATAPWHRFANVVTHREANMALYYLLLRGWVVFGHSEIALRSLSVILAVGALWVVIMLARSLFGRRAALLAGLLFAVEPALRPVRAGRPRVLAGAPARERLLLLLRPGHPAGGPAAPVLLDGLHRRHRARRPTATSGPRSSPSAQALSLAFLPPGRIPWRRILASAVALVVLLVPLGLLIESTDSAGVNWASGSSAGRLFTHIRSSVPHAVLDLLVLIAVVAVVVAIVVLARRRPAIGALFARQWPLFFTLCWLVVPVAAVVMLSLVDKPLLVFAT